MVTAKAATILLVDDEPALLVVTKRMLTRAGHTVETASGYDAAHRLMLGGLRPDLLITDVVLPGHNGKRIAQTVVGMCPTTKVIYVSGFMSVKVDGPVLQKPFTPRELTALVDTVLSS